MVYEGANFAYGIYQGITLDGESAELGELDLSITPFVVLAFVAILAIAAAGSVAGMKLFASTNSQRPSVP